MYRILLVDDDDALRYAIAKLLTQAGFAVAEAPSFHKALNVLEDGLPVHVLVVDAVLPGVNGFAIARMARMKHRDIKCIYMSGYDVPSHEALGPILRKPFADADLLAEVANALQTPSAADYRILFLDAEGIIQFQQEFRAEDDREADELATILGEACSDVCFAYALWNHERLIFSSQSARHAMGLPHRVLTVDECSTERQQRLVEMEEAL